MSYHFSGMDDLLHQAFSRFATIASEQMNNAIEAAPDADAAKKTIADAITSVVFSSNRDLVLTHELYTLAARDPAYRAITNAWMARSRQALEKYFDPTTARILDALIEGLTIHRALDNEPHHESVVTTAIERVTTTPARRAARVRR
jgi:DNA-binding transcriptional regulator YbjK